MGDRSKYNKLFFVILLLASAFDWSIGEEDKEYKVVLYINNHVVKDIKKASKECAEEMGIENSWKKLLRGTLPDNEQSAEYIDCAYEGVGFYDEDGHVKADELADMDLMEGTQEDLQDTVDKCNEIEKDTIAATIFAVHKCLHSDVRFLF